MSIRGFAALSVALVSLGVAACPAAASSPRLVAIGDSIAAAQGSYVDRYAARLGIADVRKLTSGDTAAQAVRSVLPTALALIDDETDTAVVTLQIGGHDYLTHNCDAGWNRPSCDYADGLYTLLTRLRTALDADPGAEQFLVLAYYNPASGLANDTERMFDLGLRGADARIDTTAHGDDWGMTDVMGWLACRSGATLVDPWAAFKAGGQSLMADTLHPNATGQAILTDLLANPTAGGPTPPCPLTTPFAVTGSISGNGQAHGAVEPRLAPTRWWFEYGPTTDYGQSTPVEALPASAGPRAVSADLPASALGTSLHVRLVVENAVGRNAGEDRVVMPGRPRLSARVRGRGLRRVVLARGVALRISSTGSSVSIHGRLRSNHHHPLVLRARLPWTAGATRHVRVALTARGRHLLRHTLRPQLTLTLLARGPGGHSRHVRLSLRLR